MMKTHEEFARFVRMLTPDDQRVFRALASCRGIKDAATRTQKSEDYVRKLLEHPPFRDAVRWGMEFPYRRDAALRGDPIVDLEVLQADRPSAEAGLIPERRRARPATASQRRTPASSLTHGPAADTKTEPSPSGEGSSDGSPAGSGTPSAESRPPRETVAALLNGPSQPPSDTVGIVYAGRGSSDVDAVPPERDSDLDPIVAGTEGPEGGCPEIAAGPPHTLDAAATGAGLPEDERDDERGESEVEAPPRRTLTDDDLQDAAAALIRFRDQGRAEVDLNLQSGELDGIIHSPAFVELVARKWLSGSYGYDLPIDFGAHLQPLQRRAAEFLSAGGTKQDAAAGVGRHRDTIHAWEQQPIFGACVRQSEIRSRQERARQRTARQEAARDQVLGLFEETVEVVRAAVRTNPQVALGTFTLLQERILEP